MTRNVGSRELKTRLGTYLRLVRQGATIVVTDRGRPVAKLVPLPPEEDDPRARLSELVAAGFLSGGNGRLEPLEPVVYDGPPLAEAIVEDRADRC